LTRREHLVHTVAVGRANRDLDPPALPVECTWANSFPAFKMTENRPCETLMPCACKAAPS
jgi:hypothetical protein